MYTVKQTLKQIDSLKELDSQTDSLNELDSCQYY